MDFESTQTINRSDAVYLLKRQGKLVHGNECNERLSDMLTIESEYVNYHVVDNSFDDNEYDNSRVW